MPVEIAFPVHVRVGDKEACWGEVTIELTDGKVEEAVFRRQVAGFLREAADELEKPAEDDEGVPGAAP